MSMSMSSLYGYFMSMYLAWDITGAINANVTSLERYDAMLKSSSSNIVGLFNVNVVSVGIIWSIPISSGRDFITKSVSSARAITTKKQYP